MKYYLTRSAQWFCAVTIYLIYLSAIVPTYHDYFVVTLGFAQFNVAACVVFLICAAALWRLE